MEIKALLLIAPIIVITVYRPAIGLALFLLIGAFKDTFFLSAAPRYLDLTILTGVALFIMVVKQIRPRSPMPGAGLPKAYAWLAVFCLFMLASLVYTLNLPAGLDKTARFLSLSVLAAAAPIFLIKERSDQKDFLFTLLIIGGLTAVVGFIGWLANPVDLASAWGANHIVLGRLSAIAVLIGIALAVFGSIRYQRRLGAGAAAIGAGALIVSSARGPLLALVIALPAAFLFLGSSNRFSWIKISLISVTLPLTTWFIIAMGWLPRIFSDRLWSVMAIVAGGNSDGSTTNRLFLAGRGLQAIASSPLIGLGAGSFPSVAWDLPANRYPHNIIIEVAAELGIPSLICLAAFILASAIALKKVAFRSEAGEDRLISFALGGLLIFCLVNAFISGDLNDNRMLLATVGAIFAHVGLAESRRAATEDRVLRSKPV